MLNRSSLRATGVALPAALVAVPLLWLFASWRTIDADIWTHLLETQMFDLVMHSAILMVGVGVGTLVLGGGLAWINGRCNYPGRRVMEILLVLPLAMPGYVLAFVYSGGLSYGSAIRTNLREWLGTDPGWIDPHQPWMVILILTLSLYPYVYLLGRASFMRQSVSQWEAGRAAGLSSWQVFYRISLPLARPALAAGMLLAIIEALADFGAVSVLGFDTFTTAIYKSWFGLFSLTTAAQLATLLLVLIAIVVVVERHFRGRAAYYSNASGADWPRFDLRPGSALAVICGQAAIALVAVGYPVWQLVQWMDWSAVSGLVDSAVASLTLGIVGSLIIVPVAVYLAVAVQPKARSVWVRSGLQLSLAGYAIPGTVLAVAILGSMAMIGGAGGAALQFLAAFGLLALLFSYLVRFLRVGFSAVDANSSQLNPTHGDVGASLGAGLGKRFTMITWPVIRPGVMIAFLLCMVEIVKELPATLMLRPFGWDTLAIDIYQLTSEGEWRLAAAPALALVLVSMLPTVFLLRSDPHSRIDG